MPVSSCSSPSVSFRPMCSASSTNPTTGTELLRAQLDQLHAEAENTRAKANNARLRLLRLSEAAEKLRQRASINIQKGNEIDARELLFQKKKIMQALEKSKSRIQLLDELSAKLNEAISVKETQLIGNVAQDFEVGGDSKSSPVRVVPPKQDVVEVVHENESFGLDVPEHGEKKEFDACPGLEANPVVEKIPDHVQQSISVGRSEKNGMVDGLYEVSSFYNFLEGLDEQLKKIEEELSTVLRVSSLILDGAGNQDNIRMQQTIQLLEGVQDIRGRISSMMQKVETK